MLKRQLERALADSTATVLNRNNSDNRLEAVTAVPDSSPLAATIPEAEPEDCLAVRFGQPAERAAGSAPLLACELCDALEGSTTLKLAETRAATDALTGLANRRAAEETLKLMVANASRTLAPCAVVMFDRPLQEGQRHLRPREGRPSARLGRRHRDLDDPCERLRRALRR
jgi:GGDEF domain-containing protein